MKCIEQLHLATQYLAMAGKSFLEHRSDDSHTNVGFFEENHTLRTWPLDDLGTYLGFSFDDFTLQWGAKDGKISFALESKTHGETVAWISKMSRASAFGKPYSYNLHYDLPYTISDDFKFELSHPKDLNQLLQLRILAQNTLETFLCNEKLESDIRIWPHHLDTGAFVMLRDNSGKSVGLGMAIPDSVYNDHYFYVSGYKGHDSIPIDSFSELTHGEWRNETFKGAILPAISSSRETVVRFFKDAFLALKKES